MNIYAVDFFCGAGGVTKGLQDAGIDVILGIDCDSSSRITYEKNTGVEFLACDLMELSFKELIQKIEFKTGQSLAKKSNFKLLFAGCAPCQPFSKVRKDGKVDSKALLLMRFLDFIKRFKPDYLFSENVQQVQNHPIFNDFKKGLERLKYTPAFRVFNAKDFGIAQNRERLVLLAARGMTLSLPNPPKKLKTVRETISHYPSIKAGECCLTIPNHRAAVLSSLNLLRISNTPSDGGDLPAALRPSCHRKPGVLFYDVYGRMAWDKVSPTLTTRCDSYSNGRYGHPEQNRAISLREAAALQGFPDNFIFYGSKREISRQIGNAVPPSFAEFFARWLVAR